MATANEMPNYRFGVRGVVIAIKTAQGYETPWVENGAESIDESGRATASGTTFFSDDGKPATVNGATGNDTITIQFAEFSDDYQTKVLGHKIDDNGILVKSKDDEGAEFAIGFEVQGTKGKTRIWKTGCTSSEPAASAFQTKGENIQFATPTLTGSATVLSNDVWKTVSEKFTSLTDAEVWIKTQLNIALTYTAVTPASGDNPKAKGWYERTGTGTTEDPYVYTKTTDTTVSDQKTYYEAS